MKSIISSCVYAVLPDDLKEKNKISNKASELCLKIINEGEKMSIMRIKHLEEYIEKLEETINDHISDVKYKEVLLDGENYKRCPKCDAIVYIDDLHYFTQDDGINLETSITGCELCD